MQKSQLILSLKILRALQIRCLRECPWREIFTYIYLYLPAPEPKDPVHKANLEKERKAIAAYCKHIESKEETESQVFLPSEAKTRAACKEDDKDSVAESSKADIYEKPEISEEKQSMPPQSSDDNKEENKDSDVHSDDDKEENKAPMFTLMMSGKKPKALMFICQALYMWGINRENETEMKTTLAF